jgi:hypothetical protein
MVSWVVLVKTTEGTQTIPLEADFVDTSDDGKEVHFGSIATAVDAVEAIESLKPDLPREESVAAFKKLIRALSKMPVASFKSEAVIGYFQVSESPAEPAAR